MRASDQTVWISDVIHITGLRGAAVKCKECDVSNAEMYRVLEDGELHDYCAEHRPS